MFKVQWFRFGGWRCSPLNAALVAMRKNAAKSQNLAVKAQSKVVFSRSNPVLDISDKTQIWHYRTADLFFGVVSPFSSALHCSNGFSN